MESVRQTTLSDLKTQFSDAFERKYFDCCPLDIFFRGYDGGYREILRKSHGVSFSDMHQSQKDLLYLAVMDYLQFRSETDLPEGCVITEAEFPRPAILETSPKAEKQTSDAVATNRDHAPPSEICHSGSWKQCPFLQHRGHRKVIALLAILYLVLLAAVLLGGASTSPSTTTVNVSTSRNPAASLHGVIPMPEAPTAASLPPPPAPMVPATGH
ncbi:hypothetical protein HHS34_005465 [Acidithiobacillus montserratensis]|uniref:Uncharacterized protein n=1 Tax=Acidithiobacillus montserratensis TaxID=2729135 RepID=A0ACD5HL20_9PROT|nr:hypothetical protein [Acidithiobacillus montserratensis]MBU2749208.1 hypothetical protein [Acidithiobacillus montserratensis]